MTGRVSPDPIRRCYIHIGLQKTGTSYLQNVLWDSRDELRCQGVELLPRSKDATHRLMLALLGRRRARAGDARLRALERLSADAAKVRAPRAVISEESLSAATTEQAAALVGALPGFEPHVVVSVRDVARQLPSVWQQKVKAGREFAFSDFVDDVRAGRQAGDPFWRYQDLPETLERWEAVVPAERIHVVTVPRPGEESGLLLERFCSVLGVRADGLTTSAARGNPALGREQVELLRDVNAASDPSVRRSRGVGRTRKFYLARLLGSQGGEPARTPAAVQDWCTRTAKEQIRLLDVGGYDVVGDTEDLLPDPGTFSMGEVEEVSDAAVARSAALAIAQMLVDRDADRAEIRQLRRQAEQLRKSRTSRPLVARLRSRARRFSG